MFRYRNMVNAQGTKYVFEIDTLDYRLLCTTLLLNDHV